MAKCGNINVDDEEVIPSSDPLELEEAALLERVTGRKWGN
jgi:hypothetical protein